MSHSKIDFLRGSRKPRIGWALLALGIASNAAALWLAQQWADERADAATAEQKILQARTALGALPPAEPTLAQRRWQQAQPELRRPFLPALRAIESATVNPVFILSLTIEPAKGLIKLDAEAPSFDHALAYVQMLDESAVLQPATLVSHEQAVNPVEGRASVTFSAITHWVATSVERR